MTRRLPMRVPARLVLTVSMFVASPVVADHAPTQSVDATSAGWPLAPFALLDHRGETLSNEWLLGHWTFVLLGDTRCGAPCAAALTTLVGIGTRLAGTAKRPQVLFVSLAPERETPDTLAAYLAGFDSRFVGATGSQTTLRRLVDDLTPAAEATAVDAAATHYARSLFLIGPDGALRAEFLAPFDVPRITAAYLKGRLRG